MDLEELFGTKEAAAPAEQEAQPANEPEEAQDGDYVEAAEDVAEEGEEYSEEQEDAPQSVDKPKRSKMIPRDRFDEINERAKSLEAQLQQMQWQYEQQKQANEQLLGMSKQEESQDDDEILDVALEKKLGSKVDAMQKQFMKQTINNEIGQAAAVDPSYGEAAKHLIGARISELMVKAQSIGRQISPEQAQGMVIESLENEIAQAKGYNPNIHAAAYIMQHANAYGFAGKKPSETQKNKVDLKAVKELQEQAGAPNIQKQSFNAGAGSNIRNEIREQNKQAGVDENVSSMFFG